MLTNLLGILRAISNILMVVTVVHGQQKISFYAEVIESKIPCGRSFSKQDRLIISFV